MRNAIIAAIVAALVSSAGTMAASSTGFVQLAEGVAIQENGGNAYRTYGLPGASLALNHGEIVGVRDIQGGTIVPGHPDMNHLDVGAGNWQQPGLLGIGADVTRTIVFHVKRPGSARPKKMLSITPRGITFHVRPKFKPARSDY